MNDAHNLRQADKGPAPTVLCSYIVIMVFLIQAQHELNILRMQDLYMYQIYTESDAKGNHHSK